MNTRPTELRRVSDVRAQIELERKHAARRAAMDARETNYRATRECAMRCAERERILRAWRRPEPPSFRRYLAAEVAAAKRVWQQIAQEIVAAPVHMKVGTAVFFGAGAGAGAWIALLCGWLS